MKQSHPSLIRSVVSSFVMLVATIAQAEVSDLTGISEADYGELYVSQAKSQVTHPWQLGAGYSFGFTNPYLGIHGLHAQVAYQWGRFLQTGIEATVFATQETGLASRLQAELAAQDIETKIARPFYTAHMTIAVIPLSGVINLFSVRAVTLELPIQLGIGASRYVGASQLYPSFRMGLTPQAFFTEQLGVQLGLHTQLEHFGGGDWQNRWDAQIGFVGRL